jgi:tRNA/rRNA methyltransferase
MSNFGFTRLRVVTPYEASFREARSAVGASKLLESAQEYPSVAEAVADCTLVVGTTAAHHRELKHRLLPLEEGAQLIRKELSSGRATATPEAKSASGAVPRVALLFGSEKRGLSNRDFSHCHWLLRLPTREEHPSMNLGQAVAVALYELARGTGSSRAARVRNSQPKQTKSGASAAAGELERLTEMLLEALGASGYPHAETVASKEKVRRLVRRLKLDAADAETLLGMLRQILWKLRKGG